MIRHRAALRLIPRKIETSSTWPSTTRATMKKISHRSTPMRTSPRSLSQAARTRRTLPRSKVRLMLMPELITKKRKSRGAPAPWWGRRQDSIIQNLALDLHLHGLRLELPRSHSGEPSSEPKPGLRLGPEVKQRRWHILRLEPGDELRSVLGINQVLWPGLRLEPGDGPRSEQEVNQVIRPGLWLEQGQELRSGSEVSQRHRPGL